MRVTVLDAEMEAHVEVGRLRPHQENCPGSVSAPSTRARFGRRRAMAGSEKTAPMTEAVNEHEEGQTQSSHAVN